VATAYYLPPTAFSLSLCLVRSLDCDALAAFGAAAGQDGAAIFSGHAAAEAVDLVPAALFRLVCSFRCHVFGDLPGFGGITYVAHPNLGKSVWVSYATHYIKNCDFFQDLVLSIHGLSTSLTSRGALVEIRQLFPFRTYFYGHERTLAGHPGRA
jgi:hypothetical protein